MPTKKAKKPASKQTKASVKAVKGGKKPAAKLAKASEKPKTKPAAPPKVTEPPRKAAPSSKKASPAPAVAQSSVDEYVAKVAPWQRVIIGKLRGIVREAAPSVTETLKWGQPVYEHKGPFSYIKAHAAQVNFGFWRGADLEDKKHLLTGEGARMRHVKISESETVDDEALAAFVRQAVALNDKKGDPTKG